jgi:hypothetical protein
MLNLALPLSCLYNNCFFNFFLLRKYFLGCLGLIFDFRIILGNFSILRFLIFLFDFLRDFLFFKNSFVLYFSITSSSLYLLCSNVFLIAQEQNSSKSIFPLPSTSILLNYYFTFWMPTPHYYTNFTALLNS